jgi:hypothetical protein
MKPMKELICKGRGFFWDLSPISDAWTDCVSRTQPQMRKLIKFVQTSAADQLVVLRLNQNAEVAK